MLNTDQYNPQVKNKMTKPDFIKNNRGIDEGKDLDPAVLEEMFDEIAAQEIVLKDEHLAKFDNDVDATDGRYRTRKEIAQIAIANENMALKTEAMFNTIQSGQRSPSAGGSVYYQATNFEHVKLMFEIIWMFILVRNMLLIPLDWSFFSSATDSRFRGHFFIIIGLQERLQDLLHV
jgi:brefeldin A-inhibited guanine nucleotide-exchange protein